MQVLARSSLAGWQENSIICRSSLWDTGQLTAVMEYAMYGLVQLLDN